MIFDEFYIGSDDQGLKLLVDYCSRADSMRLEEKEKGKGSMRYCFALLGEHLDDDYIFRIFCDSAEKIVEDERYLTEFCMDRVIAYAPETERFFRMAEDYEGKQPRIEFKDLKGLRIAINESEENLTNYIFKSYADVDVIVYKNWQRSWAGIVLRSVERNVKDCIDLRKVYGELSRDERGWFLHPSGNLLLCGTPKNPGVKCRRGIEEILRILEKGVE